MKPFSCKVFKQGINPCVTLPLKILAELFQQNGKTKGPIPVHGTLNNTSFTQTIVKYQGKWRLYLNTQMRRDAKVQTGDWVKIQLAFDPKPRVISMPPSFKTALFKNKKAQQVFERLSLSHQKEILRYLNSLKTSEALKRNIRKVIQEVLAKKPGKDK